MLLDIQFYSKIKIIFIIYLLYIGNLIYANDIIDNDNKTIMIHYGFVYDVSTTEVLTIHLDKIYSGGYYDLNNILYPNNYIIFKEIKLWCPNYNMGKSNIDLKLFFEENIIPCLKNYDPDRNYNNNKIIYNKFIKKSPLKKISLQDIENNEIIINKINMKKIFPFSLKGIYIDYCVGCILLFPRY